MLLIDAVLEMEDVDVEELDEDTVQVMIDEIINNPLGISDNSTINTDHEEDFPDGALPFEVWAADDDELPNDPAPCCFEIP